jgi:hypothetical protein
VHIGYFVSWSKRTRQGECVTSTLYLRDRPGVREALTPVRLEHFPEKAVSLFSPSRGTLSNPIVHLYSL